MTLKHIYVHIFAVYSYVEIPQCHKRLHKHSKIVIKGTCDNLARTASTATQTHIPCANTRNRLTNKSLPPRICLQLNSTPMPQASKFASKWRYVKPPRERDELSKSNSNRSWPKVVPPFDVNMIASSFYHNVKIRPGVVFTVYNYMIASSFFHNVKIRPGVVFTFCNYM